MTRTLSSKVLNRFFLEAGIMTAAFALVVLPAVTHADTFNRQLSLGSSGTDVSTLQAFLATDATLYPQGLVTGYFGSLTSAAVSNFQVRNGLPAVGRVGPQTLAVLNLQVANGSGDTDAAIITSIGISPTSNSATVSWNTNEGARGVVYYSTSPLSLTNEQPKSVTVSGLSAVTDGSYRIAQTLTLQGLSANTTYYYLIYSIDQSGNISLTWPSTFHTGN